MMTFIFYNTLLMETVSIQADKEFDAWQALYKTDIYYKGLDEKMFSYWEVAAFEYNNLRQ